MATSGSLSASRKSADRDTGFTLVELLVSVTILAIIVAVLFNLTAGVGNIFKTSTGKISAFQNARTAFSTLTETLSRATLNTYSDYATVAGGKIYFRHPDIPAKPNDPGNISNFVPTKFARASELHFICGPTVDIATATQTTSGNAALDIGATRDQTPGDLIYFQAALGDTTHPESYQGMKRALNSVGFYIKYDKPDPALFPPWMSNSAGAKEYRFRLLQYVEALEKLRIYSSTASPDYILDWMSFLPSKPRVRVLAEDIVLLIARPRLSPSDEAKVAVAMGSTYTPETQLGSVLSPNYHYDSRAWQSQYPSGARVNQGLNAVKRIPYMMNQLPPIIDVAMVCVDPLSLARFDRTSSTPPDAVKVPATLFVDSAQMEADLTLYGNQLAAARIRFHIERAAIEVKSAKWSNN